MVSAYLSINHSSIPPSSDVEMKRGVDGRLLVSLTSMVCCVGTKHYTLKNKGAHYSVVKASGKPY